MGHSTRALAALALTLLLGAGLAGPTPRAQPTGR